MDNFNPNTGTMGCPGPSQGCFQPFRNNYNNNPIGALQERFHRSQACYGNSNFDPLGWLEGSGLDSQFPEDGSEVGFGVYKADEFGEFKQVGFGQPKSCEAFGSFRDSSLKRDFGVLSEEYLVDSDGFQRYQEFDHPPGWGERFVSSQDQIGGFGSFRGGYGPGSVDFGQPPFARGMPRVAFGPRPGFVNNRHGPFGAHRGFFKVPRGVPSRRALRGGGRVFRGRGKAKVSMPNGLMAIGTGANKKTAKHNAARGMLDILDGRASHVSTEVSQSITDGLKALRGGHPGPVAGHETFKPKLTLNENQKRLIDKQKKHQEELLRQQMQYGPLGVKLWFSGEDKNDKEAQPRSQEQPNRGLPEPAGPTDDEELQKAHQSEFCIKEPVHQENLEEYLSKLILNSVFTALSKRPSVPIPSDLDIDRLIKNTKSNPASGAPVETICKMCNLVFAVAEQCSEHKSTADHLHVVKGYFPGEGGYHCFLCWISFQQAEGLLNHISRSNHQTRCKKKGVLRIWMEPVANKSWDLINVHKHIRDLGTEKRSSENKRRNRSRDKERKSREKDLRDEINRGRYDGHDDRGSRKTDKKRSSPDKWSHDKYSGGRKSEQFEWVKVKREKGPEDKSEHPRQRFSSNQQHVAGGLSSRDYPERGKSSSKPNSIVCASSNSHSSKRSSSTQMKERSNTNRPVEDQGYTHNQERSSSVQDDVNLYGDHEESRVRHNSESRHRLSENSETSRRGKRSRRVTGSDHEEVNEIQDDFEIDSVGKVENSEETLQKMKSAIIGILDEEISTLSKKIKK